MTFNNGSLGSRIDEERSEVRNVMRFAASVSHLVFERTWHRVMSSVYPFERFMMMNGWVGEYWPEKSMGRVVDAMHLHNGHPKGPTHYNTASGGQDYPLNLSISVSGGKETNKDCLSSGE